MVLFLIWSGKDAAVQPPRACSGLILAVSGFIVALFVFDPSNSPSLASFALSILTDLLCEH